MYVYVLPSYHNHNYCQVDTLTVSYQQLQISSNEEKQQLQDQIAQLESSLPAQQLSTSSSLSDHHQEGSHTQNSELKENHITIMMPVLLIVPTNSCQTLVCGHC